MDSFGINSIKFYDTYLDIQTTSNQKSFNYKVVDLEMYYNFGIKVCLHRTSYEKATKSFAQPITRLRNVIKKNQCPTYPNNKHM